jgi:hypothetical protein
MQGPTNAHEEPAQVVVDNSAGGDAAFATEVARRLTARGLSVEHRPANPRAKFDSGVNLLATGMAIRVPRRPERTLLAAIEEDVRAALQHRPSERRRTRSVPVYLGEGARVLEWIDLFG